MPSSLAAGEFQHLSEQIRPYTLLSEQRLISLYTLVKQVCLADLPGNIVECGTYKGVASALMAWVVKQYSQRPRLVYCCDTFEGMPDPTDVDRHRGIPANATGFGAGTLEAPILENLEQICQRLQVRDLIVPVKGLFADTLPKSKQDFGDIALLHADADWYRSTQEILQHLFDPVVPGGFIQIDDYGHWEGCKKAVDEFAGARGLQFRLNHIDYTGVWLRKLRKE